MHTMFRAAAVAAFLPALAGAQTVASCRAETKDACQKADDIYTYLFPQLGTALVGGNPVLGSNRPAGGLGHFSVGIRASALKASLPQFDDIDVAVGAAQASNIPLKDQYVPVPVFDAAIGLYGGFPVGVTHVGAIDALASLTYVPDVGDDVDELRIDGKTRFGLGVQVGLLEESVVVPGISFAYLQRGLPEVSFSTSANTPATFGVNDLDVTVSSWRVIASKSFIAFALSAGIGGDTYESKGELRASAAGFTEALTLDRSESRTNWFVDLTINLGPVKLAGEYGGVTKKSQTTFNSFNPEAGAARNYFSAGLRIGF